MQLTLICSSSCVWTEIITDYNGKEWAVNVTVTEFALFYNKYKRQGKTKTHKKTGDNKTSAKQKKKKKLKKTKESKTKSKCTWQPKQQENKENSDQNEEEQSLQTVEQKNSESEETNLVDPRRLLQLFNILTSSLNDELSVPAILRQMKQNPLNDSKYKMMETYSAMLPDSITL